MAEQSSPRVIFIGDAGVGKTSIIIRVTTGSFDTSPSPTVGAGVRPVTIRVRDASCKFHLWDTAGQEIYRSIVPLYFKQAVVAVVVFSLTDANSFSNLQLWIDMLKEHAPHPVPVVIVGNKTDLDNPSVDAGAAKAWAASRNFPFFLTSAVSGDGVQTLFEHIAEGYVQNAYASGMAIAKRKPKDDDDEGGCC